MCVSKCKNMGIFRILTFLSVLTLAGCGGGGGGSDNFSSTSQSLISSALTSASSSSSSVSSSNFSSQSVSSLANVTLNGIVTYDYVPHSSTNIGLDYSAVQRRPIRGAQIEIMDDSSRLIATTVTQSDGSYSFILPQNTIVKVRVKARLLKTTLPTWNFSVTDNSSGNALYVLDGSLATVGNQNSTRNLHASSGWAGDKYSNARAAAPFAILDAIYGASIRLLDAGNTNNLPPLEVRWSTKNSAADGDVSKGEIGTSYFDGDAIYLLGDADRDTDEYDPHVLLHEWGHYLERKIYRSDSIGGSHADGDSLDIRVAFSEGFANAFAGMMIDKVIYTDASGINQASGFYFNIARKTRANKGYFNEGSIGSILYNYYLNGEVKAASEYTPINEILSSKSYQEGAALTSIFLFAHQLKSQYPAHYSVFNSLLQEQDVFGTDAFGSNESNSGGSNYILPVYKTLSPNNLAVNTCSTAEFGKPNKLGNVQFLKLTIDQAGVYTIRINKLGGMDIPTKPAFVMHKNGVQQFYVQNENNDVVAANVSLSQGSYVLEVYDDNALNTELADRNVTCFNVRIAPNL